MKTSDFDYELPAELIAQDGEYALLWGRQTGAYLE